MEHKEHVFYAKGRQDAMVPVTAIVYPHKVVATADVERLTPTMFRRALGREFPRHSFVLVSDNGVYYLADADRFTDDGLDDPPELDDHQTRTTWGPVDVYKAGDPLPSVKRFPDAGFVRLNKCDDCRKAKPTTVRRADPFMDDPDGETVYKNLCDECYGKLNDGE